VEDQDDKKENSRKVHAVKDERKRHAENAEKTYCLTDKFLLMTCGGCGSG